MSDSLLDDLGADGPGDAELVVAVRGGDTAAYGLLWERHAAAATRLARTLSRPSDVDELVSEAFTRVLSTIQRGGGPTDAFRPYLLSTLRRISIDTGLRYHNRVQLTGDDADLDVQHAAPAGEVAAERDEQSAAWRAWQSLPDESRALLWHLVVEEETPAQIAPILGISANGVSARGTRARERLRQAFLQQHLQDADNDACRLVRRRLGGYERRTLTAAHRSSVEEHLAGCDGCTLAAVEIKDVNHTLRAVVAPIALGGGAVAAGYLAHLQHAAHAARLAVLRRVLIGAGVVAVGVVLAVLFTRGGDHAARTVATYSPPPSPPPSRSVTPAPSSSPIAPPPRSSSPAPPRPVSPPPARPPTTPALVAPPPPAQPGTATGSAPSTGAPGPPAPVTRSVSVVLSHGPNAHGTVVLTAPSGWRLRTVAPSSGATCSVGTGTATCTFAVATAGDLTIRVAATGVEGSPPPLLHVTYSDGATQSRQDYPL